MEKKAVQSTLQRKFLLSKKPFQFNSPVNKILCPFVFIAHDPCEHKNRIVQHFTSELDDTNDSTVLVGISAFGFNYILSKSISSCVNYVSCTNNMKIVKCFTLIGLVFSFQR